MPFRIHVKQIHKEVIGQRFRPIGEDAEFRLPDVCPEDFNDDGIVGAFDLAFVLSAWGPCD